MLVAENTRATLVGTDLVLIVSRRAVLYSTARLRRPRVAAFAKRVARCMRGASAGLRGIYTFIFNAIYIIYTMYNM